MRSPLPPIAPRPPGAVSSKRSRSPRASRKRGGERGARGPEKRTGPRGAPEEETAAIGDGSGGEKIKDLEASWGTWRGSGALPAEGVRQRLRSFPREARLPLWVAVWGERLVRLPEAPSDGQVLVYSAAERLHYYVRENAVRRSDGETDALTTALARIHFAELVSRGQPRERRAARAELLRDYHPDKTNGSPLWAEAINYIQAVFAEER